jgi:hypothetical protein
MPFPTTAARQSGYTPHLRYHRSAARREAATARGHECNYRSRTRRAGGVTPETPRPTRNIISARVLGESEARGRRPLVMHVAARRLDWLRL